MLFSFWGLLQVFACFLVFFGSWDTDIENVAYLVQSGDITVVERLGLAGYDYDEDDILNVVKILPVTQLMGMYNSCEHTKVKHQL